MIRKCFCLALVCLVCSINAFANAQQELGTWPPRTVEILCGADAASGTDAIGQAITSYMSKRFGSNFYMNSSGTGNGTVSYEKARNGPKDGSMLTFNVPNMLFQYVWGAYDKDPVKDFTFVYNLQIPYDNYAFAVKADSKYKTFHDLIEDVKARPNMVSTPTGNRSLQFARVAAMELDWGVTFRKVDASGNGERFAMLLGGTTDFILIGPTTLKPYVESGDVRVLAYYGVERSRAMPDVPCTKELGYLMDQPNLAGHHIILGPSGMDEKMVNTIAEAFKGFCEDETSREIIYRLEGAYPVYYPREETYKKFLEVNDFAKKIATIY